MTNNKEQDFTEIDEIRKKVDNDISKIKGVMCIGTGLLGYPETDVRAPYDKKHKNKKCIAIFVQDINDIYEIPKEIEGIPVDIIEQKEILKPLGTNFVRTRPIIPGYSIGNFRIGMGSGTFGMVVKEWLGDIGGFRNLIFSNKHVLVDMSIPTVGDDIVQPGRADAAITGNEVGDLLRWITLQGGSTLNTGPFPVDNTVDVAVATIRAGINITLFISSLGIPTTSRTGRPPTQLAVLKSGRTTGVTWGGITHVGINDVVVGPYRDGRFYRFDDQIRTTVFARPGDSGSVLCTRTWDETNRRWNARVEGLIFAIDANSNAFANRIDLALQGVSVTV